LGWSDQENFSVGFTAVSKIPGSQGEKKFVEVGKISSLLRLCKKGFSK